MDINRRILVYGPAYLDVVVETDQVLVPGAQALLLDQSLPAVDVAPRSDGLLQILGPTGDALTFQLPPSSTDAELTCTLAEPVLARLLGADTTQTVTGIFPVAQCRTQLGGMGAGYALTFEGTLRMPLGADAVGRAVQAMLSAQQIHVAPNMLPTCPSDTTLLLLSARGDKLAIGVRQAMVRWCTNDDDRALVASCDALVFCGAPNALLAEILSWRPQVPVMCAPAMRNVQDTDPPLISLAGDIHYLTMNALEWAHLAGRELMRDQVPVITITDGPHGSYVYYHGRETFVPSISRTTPANTNRAGETYSATFFKVLRRACPNFFRTGVITTELAELAGEIATRQASRQLDLVEFAFPPDDWVGEVTPCGVT